jgi:hypothetical protein
VAWLEVALTGATTAEFERQILELQPFLDANWRTRTEPGDRAACCPRRPAVVVLYRDGPAVHARPGDPARGAAPADFDLVLASQPFRLRADAGFKARRGARAAGARAAARWADARDPFGWQRPGARDRPSGVAGRGPVHRPRGACCSTPRARRSGDDAGAFTFEPLPNSRALFRYEMHTLPEEIGSEATIGTSTLLAAWNAATYVAQIDDERLAQAMSNSGYLDATARCCASTASCGSTTRAT